MSSGQLLCLLLAFPFCFSTNTSGVGVTEDVTVSSGDSALLLCPLQFNSSKRLNVKWEKDGQRFCEYYINNTKIDAPKCNSKFKINTRLDISVLNIMDVESSDAGHYKCLMTKLIPPPSEEKTVTLWLKVLSLTLRLLNSTNSSCVELLCSLQGLNSEQVNFTWTNANQFLHNKTSIMNNTLTLCKPAWTDGETITCHAYYSNHHTFHKSITLPCNSVGCNGVDLPWLIIAASSTCAGLFLLILLGVAIFKCKLRNAANGRVFYRNKIYENFIFSNATMNPTSNAPQNAQPAIKTNIRSTTRSTPHTITQTQPEECIYEN